MTNTEFVEASNKLENYYEKEYTTEQLRIMFEELKELSVERYRKIINKCLRTCKFLPKIADIIKANNELIDNIQTHQENTVACEKCDGTGLVMYVKYKINGANKIPYTFAARCTCENANRLSEQIPRYCDLGIEIGTRKQQIEDVYRKI